MGKELNKDREGGKHEGTEKLKDHDPGQDEHSTHHYSCQQH